MNELTSESVIHIVHDVVNKHRSPYKQKIKILDNEIYQDGDWWYIPVRADMEVAGKNDYYEFLSDIEWILQDEQDLNITLMPAAPDED